MAKHSYRVDEPIVVDAVDHNDPPPTAANESNVDHVVVYQNAGGEWSWHGVAGNGEIVSEGESHTREQDAERAVRGVFGDTVAIVRAEGATG